MVKIVFRNISHLLGDKSWQNFEQGWAFATSLQKATNSRRNHVYTATLFDSKTFKAEAAVTWRKNKKIAILVLTPTLNLTQTLTLTLILTQTQNLSQTLNVDLKNKEYMSKQVLTFSFLILFRGVT